MQPQLFFVEDFTIKPSQRANFQETIKEFIDLFKAHNFKYSVNSYWTSDFHMYFTFPIKDIGDVGSLFSEADAFSEKVGKEKWTELHQKEFNDTEAYQYGLYYMRPDLSYIPENPRLAVGEANYTEWTFVLIKPGMEAEAEAVWKEWVSFYKEKGIPDPFYVWEAFIGPELPLHIIISQGENAIDFHQAASSNMEKLGEDVSELYEKTFKLLKRIENKRGWVQRDLSYTPNGE